MTTRLTRTLVACAGLVLAATLSGCGSDSGDGAAGFQAKRAATVWGRSRNARRLLRHPVQADVLEGDTFSGFDGDLVNEIAQGRP